MFTASLLGQTLLQDGAGLLWPPLSPCTGWYLKLVLYVSLAQVRHQKNDSETTAPRLMLSDT